MKRAPRSLQHHVLYRKYNGQDSEISALLGKCGSISLDGSTAIGLESHLFLFKGTNQVHQKYFDGGAEAHAKSWESLINLRSQRAASLGSTFLQLIIPEKQSVLTGLYPFEIKSPTPALQEIGRRIGHADSFMDTLHVLREIHQAGLCPFRRVDTHLSFFGASAIVDAYLKRIAPDTVISKPSMLEARMSGDLGRKFFRGRIFEKIQAPVLDTWDFSQISPVCRLVQDPADGHIGIRREWTCHRSILDKSVVVFGNSMFERGGEPFGLSWWFSRIFRETTFVWIPEVDYEVVERKSPDYVVAQTVERFLGFLPSR